VWEESGEAIEEDSFDPAQEESGEAIEEDSFDPAQDKR